VSGVVTLKGQPMANIVVSFEPIYDSMRSRDALAQPGSFGVTDEDGQYELNWSHGTGAVPGGHRVIFVWRDSTRDDSEPEDAPPKRSAGEYVQLEKAQEFRLPWEARDGSIRFTVPDTGTDDADFAF
jgi:hypothetical protein